MLGALSALSFESFRCRVGWSGSVEGTLEVLEPDPELLSLASRRCSVGLSGSVVDVLDPLPLVLVCVVLDVSVDPDPELLSLPSFRCSVGLSESAVVELLPASFTTCGGCFDIGGFAVACQGRNGCDRVCFFHNDTGYRAAFSSAR